MSKEIISSHAPIRTIRAVCVDTQMLRNVATNWGKKNQVKLVFETEELKGNGYPRTATRTLNESYYEKGKLRKVLECWLARNLNASEMLNGFPFERLVGKAAEIDVQDARTDDGTAYLRIVAIRPSLGNPLKPTGSYRRWEESTPAAKKSPSVPAAVGGDENDLEAQAEQHLAEIESGEPQELTGSTDNADAVVVTAGN
jgi:hypothetical protein